VRASARLAQIVLIGTAAAICVLIATGPLLSDDAPAVPTHVPPAPAGSETGPHAPSATCLRPLPKTASRGDLPRVMVPGELAVAADVHHVLACWEAAAADFEPVGPHEKRRLLALHHPGRSAHELDLICELRGPIDARRLADRYVWQTPVDGRAHLELTAETHDAVERLFFRGFAVKLDRATLRPVSIRFLDATGAAGSPAFALETSLCIEARLARAFHDPDILGPALVPAALFIDEEPLLPPAELPPLPEARPVQP
jgi:hypothetical protein